MLIRALVIVTVTISSANSLTADEKPTGKQKSENEKKLKLPAGVLPTIKQFIPTEKIEADSAISLPVDI